MSPEDPVVTGPSAETETSKNMAVDDMPAATEAPTENNILDMLMQQVEAQSESSTVIPAVNTNAASGAPNVIAAAAQPDETPTADVDGSPSADIDMAAVETQAVEQIHSEAAAATLAAEPAGEHPAQREWETDSSPYESSDSDTSSDDSSSEDSDEDADGDYAMMNPEEAARMLMEDGGSDDEGKAKGSTGVTLRTQNERPEEVIPKPDVIVTEDMQIHELGCTEFVVENSVVVKGKTSGEYQVLESGSVLCLKDRSVIGVVAETIGRVEQPMYTVRFTNEEAIKEAGVFDKGTIIYYVQHHSTFVFTQPLKGLKGSDASNIHDEEVGDDEMEFSDDEKEAEHKRQLKLKRQGRKDDGGRGGRGRGRGGHAGPSRLPSLPESAPGNVGSLDYDDGDGYTPLARPANLHEMMTGAEPGELPDGSPPTRQTPHRAGTQQNRGGRGRGRGRGGHNDRGGRGGGYQNRGGHSQSGYNNNAHNPQQNSPAQFPSTHFNPFGGVMPNVQQRGFPPDFSHAFAQAAAQYPNVPSMPFPPPPPPPPGQMFGFGQQQGQQNFDGAASQAAFAQMQRQIQEMQRAQQQNYGSGPNGGGY